MEAEWVSAWASVGAAIGTVATLVFAVSVLWVEQRERARQEIRRVRCWLEIRKPEDLRPVETRAEAEAQLQLKVKPIAIAENASDEVIYHVHLWVVGHSFRAATGKFLERMHPGAHERLTILPELTLKEARFSSNAKSNSAEMAFTDGRGRRWHRSRHGRLTPVHPLRPWAPWRVIPLHDWGELDSVPWWAFATRWRYRKHGPVTHHRQDPGRPWQAFRE